jgi:hypothetical protein
MEKCNIFASNSASCLAKHFEALLVSVFCYCHKSIFHVMIVFPNSYD